MKYTKLLFSIATIMLLCSFAADWVPFSSKEGRFKAQFPRQPAHSTQATSAAGKPLKMQVFMYDAKLYKDDNLLYYVMYCDFPKDMVNSDFRDEIVDTILNSCLTSAAATMGGKLVSLSKTTYGEFPGRTAKYDVSNGTGTCYMNVYLVHSRMYLLACVCEPKNDNNASMQMEKTL